MKSDLPIYNKIFSRGVKRLFDFFISIIALIVSSPIFVIAAAGIKLSSPGPVFYRAERAGKNTEPITVYKFRTMKVGADKEGAITAKSDGRIFKWGNLLRITKIDELPQLFNILNGSMSIVGPRPEDTNIVKKYYTRAEMKTLDVLPGLVCPGSIFNYTHGDMYLNGENATAEYIKELLHVKLALDLYYLNNWSLVYDLRIILRTVIAIFLTVILKKRLDYPLEFKMLYWEKEGNNNG